MHNVIWQCIFGESSIALDIGKKDGDIALLTQTLVLFQTPGDDLKIYFVKNRSSYSHVMCWYSLASQPDMWLNPKRSAKRCSLAFSSPANDPCLRDDHATRGAFGLATTRMRVWISLARLVSSNVGPGLFSGLSLSGKNSIFGMGAKINEVFV